MYQVAPMMDPTKLIRKLENVIRDAPADPMSQV